MPPELTKLLTYLNASVADFVPVEAKYFARLKELLVFHNIIPDTQAVDRTNFSEFVKQFQSTVMNDPRPDGIPGANTLWVMQQDWAGTRGITLVKSGIPNDPFKGAPLAFVLRSDVAVFYRSFYDEIHANGGVVTSDGALRPLSDVVGPGRSATSMHYTGIAFDVNIASGMGNPAADPYIIERVGTRHWQVWNRVSAPNGDQKTLNAVVYNKNNNTISTAPLTAQVIDFSGIAKKNGLSDIGNRSCFPGQYICAEWWHFQCEEVLVPYISQFGAELLTVYPQAKLIANAPIWAAKQKIYKKDWN